MNQSLHCALPLALAVLAMSARAQDPTQTDGDKYKPLLDNPCVRVLQYRDTPGDKTQQHRHPAFVLVALNAFKRHIRLPDGKVMAREFKPGDVMWSPAQTHIGENVGDTPTQALLIEMKPATSAHAECNAQ